MTNRVEAALYNNKDLIVTIEEIITNKSSKSSAIVNSRGVAYEPTYAILIKAAVPVRDDTSIASSIIIELLISQKSKIDLRMEKVDVTLLQILKVL